MSNYRLTVFGTFDGCSYELILERCEADNLERLEDYVRQRRLEVGEPDEFGFRITHVRFEEVRP